MSQYQPETLPKLPRKLCPYQVLYAEGQHMKSKLCNAQAGDCGWCIDHEYVQEILQPAWTLGFPEYVAAYLNKRPCITIGPGQGNWEVYAVHHSRMHHDDLKNRLDAHVQAWRNMEVAS